MNRYVLLLIAGAGIAVIGILLWRGQHGASALDAGGRIEIRSIPSTQPSTSPLEIESVKVTSSKILSEQELRDIAATKPWLRETEWFKSTTRNSQANTQP